MNLNDQSAGGYDFILMDYQMPNMDGPTAISRLHRATQGYTGFILDPTTGNAVAIDKDTMVTAGPNAVLIKRYLHTLGHSAESNAWRIRMPAIMCIYIYTLANTNFDL